MKKPIHKFIVENKRISWSLASPIVIAITLVGVLVVVSTFAAGSLAAFDPEAGVLAGGAKVSALSGASGGSVVAFGKASTPTPTPAPVYCGGAASCYGRSDMAAHASTGNCWAYIDTTIYNMTSFGGVHSGGRSTVENSSICGGSALAALNAAPSNSKHTSAKVNTQSTLLSFKVGTYDPNKP